MGDIKASRHPVEAFFRSKLTPASIPSVYASIEIRTDMAGRSTCELHKDCRKLCDIFSGAHQRSKQFEIPSTSSSNQHRKPTHREGSTPSTLYSEHGGSHAHLTFESNRAIRPMPDSADLGLHNKMIMPSFLLAIPTEIRLMVLEYFVPTGLIEDGTAGCRKLEGTISLMRTCKLLAVETKHVLYHSINRPVRIKVDYTRIRFLNHNFRCQNIHKVHKSELGRTGEREDKHIVFMSPANFGAFRHFDINVDTRNFVRPSDDSRYHDFLESFRRLLSNMFE